MTDSNVYDSWNEEERTFCRNVFKKTFDREEKRGHELINQRFRQWEKFYKQGMKAKSEGDEMKRIINILATSTRGKRSSSEKEYLKRFIVRNLTCIPKSLLSSEMDQLCNEIDWIPFIGKSILFLQGDFGNVYYMIAQGSVGLFLEPSKDREMSIAREFGHLRAKPFTGRDEELKSLGNNIANLQRGAGFGEIAILATTNKIRMCAAVSLDDTSLMMIMHADTYNAVLRQHHYRQKQLSVATNLLSELPLFKTFAYSKIATIAYTMTNQTFSAQSRIVQFNDVIQQVMLIVKGQVKTYATPVSLSELSRDPEIGRLLKKRIPQLAISFLGRGQIIGEAEVYSGLDRFQHTYEAATSQTEVLQIPIDVFRENIAVGVVEEEALESVHRIHREKEQRQKTRLGRARDLIKSMVGSEDVGELKSKQQLLNLLPVILDSQVPQSMAPVTVYRRPEGVSNMSLKSDSVSLASPTRNTDSLSLAEKLKKTAMMPPTMKNTAPPSFRSPRKMTFSGLM
mmetsp:Transcript_15227/g.20871  ORF Transcript_15227/g.20871 Transcript_15227/m.20871 type:complete len:511 (-) Transcript_15227:1550-3082(-)